MLRRSETSPLDQTHSSLKKQKYSSSSSSSHCLTLLTLATISIQLLLLLLHSSRRSTSKPLPQDCNSGLVYVYDLPPYFNKDLIDDCDTLTPWRSLCDQLSNSGFGPKTTDLAGTIPDHLLSSWHTTDQFAAELIYHYRILSHPCRTTNPSHATAFYIPFYAGLAVGKHLWSPNSTAQDRDRDCSLLLNWLAKQESWNQSNGQDHFIVLGRITWDFRRAKDSDWGSSFLFMPAMRHVTRLLLERSPWDKRDVGIPYPTGFHPTTPGEVRDWQSFVLSQNRSTLFSFAGSARARFTDDFRGLLMKECEQAEEQCRSVSCMADGQCIGGGGSALSLFLNSAFCLQPRGDSFTRRSMFDCIVAGAIPVMFWRRSAYEQYEWYLPMGEEKEKEWSVFVDRRKVRRGVVRVKEVLEGIEEEKVRRMREKVVELIPKLVYSAGRGYMEDAVDVALNGLFRRVEDRRRSRSREVDKPGGGGTFAWFGAA
ncbi:Exostosin-like protein [Dioscorea alata]|uniref:Exostosin-like protein n=1 Tax=Dioscorea alata TaxID=55571 RepID=A0ACB7V4G7_DIOAL|nr:Exostosin-like protein [Dioscorea alata]